MPVIVVGAEKTFSALRPRIFTAKLSTAAAREVAEAVRVANPTVDLDKLEPGTVLTVPDVPGVRTRGELSLDETVTSGIEALANAGAAALEELAAIAKSRASESAAERKQLGASLDSKELEAAVRKDKTLAPDVAAVRQALAEEEAGAKDRAAALKKAQDEWTAELDALKQMLG
jgi:hypothetical protein